MNDLGKNLLLWVVVAAVLMVVFQSFSPKLAGAASTEIARNVEHIAQMAEQNSAAVRDTAETAQRLKSLAQQLRDEVAHFKI